MYAQNVLILSERLHHFPVFNRYLCYRHNVFINDGTSDEEDIPIAENIYSDASSDTESSDDDEDSDYSAHSYPSSDSLLDVIQELDDFLVFEPIVEIDTSHICPRVDETRPAPAQPSTFAEKPGAAPKKFKSNVGRSRQGVGKKKARRIENGKLIVFANFISFVRFNFDIIQPQNWSIST